MRHIIEYNEEDFFNIIKDIPALIDRLHLFEVRNGELYYIGDCQDTDECYQFYYPHHKWKIKHTSDILKSIDDIRAENETLYISDFDNYNDLINDICYNYLDKSITTKFWIIKNDENCYSSMVNSVMNGQFFTILL